MNYGQIRTQFKAILNRSDCTDALADTFISQGLARAQRILRAPVNERSAVSTVSVGFTGLSVPNDLVEVISLDADGNNVRFMPTQRFLELEYTMQGLPQYWTRIGATIKVKPTPGAGTVLTLYYYGEFDPFTSDSTTTTLSTIAPDMIVYGGLSFAADYFLDERKDLFEERFQNAVIELQAQASGVEGAGSILPAYDLGDY